jgi:hypothetical protein
MPVKFALLLFALGSVGGCAGQPVIAAQPPPEAEKVEMPKAEAKTAAAPAAPAVKEPTVKEDVPCRDRFSEGACKQRPGCRWVNDYKRMDGTWASANCEGGKARGTNPGRIK